MASLVAAHGRGDAGPRQDGNELRTLGTMPDRPCPKEDIPLVPFAGWDVAAAKSFDHATYWTIRLDAPSERLHVIPDGVGKALDVAGDFVKA